MRGNFLCFLCLSPRAIFSALFRNGFRIMSELRGKAVLITGGTMGIGLAAGLAFARQGASCILTHKWSTADEDEILAKFNGENLPAPQIINADVSRSEDTDTLLQ